MNSEHIPDGQVSDERLAELIAWASSEEADCLQDDMPVSAGYYADIAKLLSALTRRSSAGVKGLEAAAKRALHEMRHTVAPRNSFTDAVDALDAALSSPSHIGEDDDIEAKALMLAELAGMDVDDYWRKQAGAMSWAAIADRAMGAVRAWRRPSPSVQPQGETSEAIARHDPKLMDDLKRIKAKLESLPEALRGPFVVAGLAPYAALASQTQGEGDDLFGWVDTKHATFFTHVKDATGLVPVFTRALTPSPTLEPTDAEVKRAAWEYLSHKGERPECVLRSGHELWETCAPAMRAALIAFRQPTSGEGV